MSNKNKATGFAICCPFCRDSDATVTIGLDKLICQCGNCDEYFSPEQARDKAAEMLNEWERVVRWVEVGRTMAAE
jgi:transcription elongation factor Elf1